MADDPRKSRTPAADSRGSLGAMLSALLVAGLLFAGAILLHYGELPAFLMPSTSLGDEATIEAKLTVGPASQDVTAVVSVPGEPKITEADDGQNEVTVSVAVENRSTVTLPVSGAGQSLRTSPTQSYDSTTDTTTQIAAGKSKTVKFRFLVPADEDPGTLVLTIGDAERKFDVS